MPEAIPVLSIRRPVQNIGQDRIDALADHLYEANKDCGVEAETVQGIFKPADKLHTTIIGRGEFLRMQRKLGPERLDEPAVKELEARLVEAFAGRPETIGTDTLPLSFKRWGSFPKLKIDMAKSPDVMEERFTAQDVIRNFMNLEGRINTWFGRASRIVPVWLAASSTGPELNLLTGAKTIVEEELFLPKTTEFGEMNIAAAAVYYKD